MSASAVKNILLLFDSRSKYQTCLTINQAVLSVSSNDGRRLAHVKKLLASFSMASNPARIVETN
jgi:hypothetical protein